MTVKKTNKKHLPMYGVGPLYVSIILLITIIFVILSHFNYIPSYNIKELKLPLMIIGIILIILSCYMWYKSVIKDKLDKYILKGKLLTSGIYSYTRNPIYSAFTILSLGILLIENNYYLLVLPFIYWLFLTILMILTEEKWLQKEFGKEYEEYKKSVNRCIPIKKIKKFKKSIT